MRTQYAAVWMPRRGARLWRRDQTGAWRLHAPGEIAVAAVGPAQLSASGECKYSAPGIRPHEAGLSTACSWSERRCRYIASDVVSLFLHSPQWTRWVWGRALADASPDLLTDHLAPLCGPPVGLAPQWRLHGSTAASSSASPPLPAAAAAAAALLHKPQQPRALTAVRPAFHHRMQYVTLGRIGEGT